MYNNNRSARGERAGGERPRGRRNDFGTFGSDRFQERKHPFVSDHWEDDEQPARQSRDSFERSDRRFERDNRRSFERDNRRSFERDDRRSFERDNRRSFERDGRRPSFRREERRGSFGREERGERRFGSDRRFERDNRRFNRDDRRSFNRDDRRPSFGRDDRRGSFGREDRRDRRRSFEREDFRPRYKHQERGDQARHAENLSKREAGYIRLNRYIANAGICSRREADTMIESGAIMVNGKVCTVLGTLVGPGDKVQLGNQTLNAEKKVYLLMNKPKGYITTADDPQERKTVMELVRDACRERIYPVGRLDRNTTGVLLFTNDGDMAKNLTHPSHGARKIYHVTLDKPLTKGDLADIAKGVMLEDGFTEVDEISYVEDGDRKEVGIQLHSGKNRIVRRIFEYFGYEVVKLDRVLFAELTKKDLKRGQWRFLTEQEINFLKVNAGAKSSRKPKSAKKEVFTEDQLAEAAAIAEAEEAPVKKRSTRKKAEMEPEAEEAPIKKRSTRKKAEVEPEAEEAPVKKRSTRKKVEVEPEAEEAPIKKRSTRKKAEVEPEAEEAPVKKRSTRKKAEVESEAEETPVKKRSTRKKAEAEPEAEEAPVKKRSTRKKA